MADLRALAERLGQMRSCECYDGRIYDGLGDHDQCWRCDGTMRRLPTEAELRAAIFEAGVEWLVMQARSDYIEMIPDEAIHRRIAREGEAAPGDLVLLALLRTLEVCRGA